MRNEAITNDTTVQKIKAWAFNEVLALLKDGDVE